MDWIRNLFSFNGCIGRVQFWLILFLGQLPALLIHLPKPFVARELTFPLAGVLGGTANVGYLQIDGAATVVDWLSLCAYGSLMASAFWVFAATMTKRLHDRGRSGKLLIPLVVGLTAVTGFAFLLRRTDRSFIPLDVAALAFFLVVTFFGCWLMMEMAFLPGDKFFSPNLAASDIRRAK